MSRLGDAWRALRGQPEERAISSTDPSLSALLGGLETPGGQLVNQHTAQNLSTVLAAVSAISTAIASLPVEVRRRGGDVDEMNPLQRLVRRGANDHQSWPDFCEWLLASTLLTGNGLSEITTDARGAVVQLKPIPWHWTSVQLLPNGRLAYDVSEVVTPFGGTGRRRRLLQDQVLHLRDRSDDGMIGVSRLRRAAGVIDAALSLFEFSGTMWRHGMHPSGVISADGKLSEEQKTQLQTRIREGHAGARNAARVLVLDQALKWQSISISPEDAELLASRRFTVEELARVYQVPPPIVGDLTHGTFTNTETLLRFFAQSTLSHWSRKLETALERQVLTEATRATHEVEVDLSGLLRGDPEVRWQSHRIAVEAGILSTDEVREVEGWRPRGTATAA